MSRIEKIEKLKEHQKVNIDEIIEQYIRANNLNPLTISPYNVVCPHCDSTKFVKNGVTCDRQRYKCSNSGCKKTFSTGTNTAVHGLKKIDLWTDFIHLLLGKESSTLVDLSKTLKISTKTAHNWKHKLLASMNRQNNIKLNGIIEMDEVYLPFLVKGKRGGEKTDEIKCIEKRHKKKKQKSVFLCVHNRQDEFHFIPLKIQRKGQVATKYIKSAVEQLNIAKDSTIVTDKSKGSIAYFKTRTDLNHITFISQGDKTKQIHNNNINSLMSNYRRWCQQFRGYSTKYIWNYLMWYRFSYKYLRNDMIQDTSSDYKLKMMVKKSVDDKKGRVRYLEISTYYEQFLRSA